MHSRSYGRRTGSDSTGVARGPAGAIAWRRLGSGPPLLLINGFAATRDDWDPALLNALARSSTVLCPDNRGLGDSAGGSEDVVVPPRNAALLAERLPASWLARFAGGGHAFLTQEPRRLARLIATFLDRRIPDPTPW